MTAPLPRIATRCLLRPADVPPHFEGFEVVGVFNPAAVQWGQQTVLLVRVAEQPRRPRDGFVALPRWDWQQGRIAVDWLPREDVESVDPRVVRLKAGGCTRLTFISWLRAALSRDGMTVDSLGDAAFVPASRYETFGVEDPRLTRIGERCYFTYVAVSAHGIATALASTTDFRTFHRHGIIFSPENKDVVLFPERIGGQYAALHRPNPREHFSTPEIWIARSPDLLHWGAHQRLLGPEVAWAGAKIGGGTPPIKTERGWLTLFHGQMEADAAGAVGPYAAAAMLLDLERPERVVGLSSQPVMVAQADFERVGFLPDIVFPTGLVRRGDEVDVYYGAADGATGVTRYALSDLLVSVAR